MAIIEVSADRCITTNEVVGPALCGGSFRRGLGKVAVLELSLEAH